MCKSLWSSYLGFPLVICSARIVPGLVCLLDKAAGRAISHPPQQIASSFSSATPAVTSQPPALTGQKRSMFGQQGAEGHGQASPGPTMVQDWGEYFSPKNYVATSSRILHRIISCGNRCSMPFGPDKSSYPKFGHKHSFPSCAFRLEWMVAFRDTIRHYFCTISSENMLQLVAT